MSTTLEQFIAQQRALVEQKEIDSAKAYWEAGMSATPEAEERAARCQAELDACYSDAVRYQFLQATPEPSDPELRRQRILLLFEFAGSQMSQSVIAELARREMEIEGIFANYRAQLRGRSVSDNDLRDILKTSNDNEERKDAWQACKQIGSQVRGKLLELVDIRNREAKRLGYDNYYAMSMALQELDENELFSTLEQVSEELEPTFVQQKVNFDAALAERFGIAVADLRPWHYGDPFFQEAPTSDEMRLDTLFDGRKLEEILLRFYGAIGLNITELLPRADLYEKPGKNQHAYCLSVGRGTGDVRVSCNLRSDAKWMSTLLHEFGHAVYDNELDPNLPFFLKSVSHIMTTEAIAEMMGRFVTNGAWLKRWAEAPEAEAARYAGIAREMQCIQMLVFTQWVQVITHFERELYRDPKQDLGNLWWDLVAKYQHLTPPEDRSPDAWASKIHLATSPVYYHNYLMGEMIASQLLHTLRSEVVPNEEDLVASPKIGRWLIEKVFRPGARYAWNELVAFATGEALNPRYFVNEMAPSTSSE